MVNKRIGRYVTQKTSSEVYKSYIPPHLPPEPPLDLQVLYPFLEKATRALAELNTITKSVPNPSLFIYMYVRKEALLSSQIEGTQSSFADVILFEHAQEPDVSIDDVEEVSNYVKALYYGLDRLKNDLPLSLRLLRAIHDVLLSGSRGTRKMPGQFRTSQNWIGGTRPGNAQFVPPHPDDMMECLSAFENFLHDNTLPVLIKAGLAHVQFETIHPFLDGNGRLGRLLIILLLCEGNVLNEPILYISLYLKQHRDVYYNLLQEVRLHGNWEAWLEFFLEGIEKSARQASHTIQEINTLFENDSKKIETLGRARFSCLQVFEYMKKLPQVSAVSLSKELHMTPPTTRDMLNHMLKLGILEEVSGKKKGKVYVYRRYLALLEEGTEPLNHV